MMGQVPKPVQKIAESQDQGRHHPSGHGEGHKKECHHHLHEDEVAIGNRQGHTHVDPRDAPKEDGQDTKRQIDGKRVKKGDCKAGKGQTP
jgi:hypothetical protein